MTQEVLTTIAAQQTADLQRVSKQLGADVVPYLNRIESGIFAILAKYEDKNITKARQDKILKDINELTKAEYAAYNKFFDTQMKLVSNEEVAAGVMALDTAIESDVDINEPKKSDVTQAVIATPIQQGDKSWTTYRNAQDSFKNGYVSEIDSAALASMQGATTGKDVADAMYSQIHYQGRKASKSVLDRSRRSANSLSATLTNHTANVTRVQFGEANSKLVKGYVFIAVLDSQTSQTCFTGETKFHPIGDLTRLYRAEYSGEIITLNLSTGEKIEGTPNHPILTKEGWTPLGEIDPSKHVVYSVLNDGVSFEGHKNVNMPTSFAELFDSLSHSSAVDVVSSDCSAVDFYGDGVRMNGKIDILSPERHLRGDFKPILDKDIVGSRLRSCHFTSILNAYSSLCHIVSRRLPAIKPPKFAPALLELVKNKASRYPQLSFYFRWPTSVIKHWNNLRPSKLDSVGDITPWSALHESDLLEKIGNSCGGDVVLTSNCGGGHAITVKPTNIVGMVREFRNTHVYTSSCGQGYYTAGGIIVKNCRSADQTTMKASNPKFSAWSPPRHRGCRSALSYDVDDRYKLDEDSTKRASSFTVDGLRDPKPVSSKGIYYDKMRSLNAADQDKIMGVTLGKAFRAGLKDGTLTPESFAKMTVVSLYAPLTLKQMSERRNALGDILRRQKG